MADLSKTLADSALDVALRGRAQKTPMVASAHLYGLGTHSAAAGKEEKGAQPENSEDARRGRFLPKTTAAPAAIAAAPAVPAAPAKKALLIGINYVGTANELHGCVNDVYDMCRLCVGWGYTEICVLFDDGWPGPEPAPKIPAQGLSGRAPTRANIEAAMRWLVADAAKGGHRFFHYSGHGSQLQDQIGKGRDEPSGWDDTIIPVDFGTAGQIRDDELRDVLVAPLANTPARLRAILDCCHSGTGFDLRFTMYDVSRYGRRNFKAGKADDEHIFVLRAPTTPSARAAADVLMISGCADFQTSDDAVFNGRANGALTRFLIDYLKGRYMTRAGEMLVTVRENLRKAGYDQVPQLSSEKPLAPDTLFDL